MIDSAKFDIAKPVTVNNPRVIFKTIIIQSMVFINNNYNHHHNNQIRGYILTFESCR